MLRRPLLLALALIASACTQATPERSELPDPATSTTVPASSTTTSTVVGNGTDTTAAPSDEPRVVVDAPGRLAIVDLSGEVIVTNSDGSEQRLITVNGFEAFHQQPVWSPDGSRLVFAEGTSEGAFVVFVENDIEVKRLPIESLPFYLQWDDSGTQVGVLRNDPETVFALDIAPATGEAGFATVVGGAPLYFDWAPAGTDVAIHASDSEVQVAGGSDDPATLNVANGPYSVPHWTPGGISHVAAVGDGFELRIVAPDGTTSPLASMATAATVVADPEGTHLAVYVPPVGRDPDVIDVAAGVVPTVDWSAFVVIDVATGEITEVARGEIVAYFWSPDGEKILYFDLDPGVGPVWKVWDAVTGEISVFSSLRLGDEFVQQIIPFFEQYALSLQLWAPDASGFAYPARVAGGTAIFVQSLEGGDPTLVSGGTWVSWSAG